MKKCLDDLQEVTEMLDREEQEEVLDKIREMEKKVRKKVLKNKQGLE